MAETDSAMAESGPARPPTVGAQGGPAPALVTKEQALLSPVEMSLEEFASISAALEAGLPREEILAEAGFTEAAWQNAQERWLSSLADQAANGRLRQGRRYVEMVGAKQTAAAARVKRTRKKLPGPSPITPAPPIAPRLTTASEKVAPTGLRQADPRISRPVAAPQAPVAMGPQAAPSPGAMGAPPVDAFARARPPEPEATGVVQIADLRRALQALPFAPNAAVDDDEEPITPRAAHRDSALPFNAPARPPTIAPEPVRPEPVPLPTSAPTPPSPVAPAPVAPPLVPLAARATYTGTETVNIEERPRRFTGTETLNLEDALSLMNALQDAPPPSGLPFGATAGASQPPATAPSAEPAAVNALPFAAAPPAAESGARGRRQHTVTLPPEGIAALIAGMAAPGALPFSPTPNTAPATNPVPPNAPGAAASALPFAPAPTATPTQPVAPATQPAAVVASALPFAAAPAAVPTQSAAPGMSALPFSPVQQAAPAQAPSPVGSALPFSPAQQAAPGAVPFNAPPARAERFSSTGPAMAPAATPAIPWNAAPQPVANQPPTAAAAPPGASQTPSIPPGPAGANQLPAAGGRSVGRTTVVWTAPQMAAAALAPTQQALTPSAPPAAQTLPQPPAAAPMQPAAPTPFQAPIAAVSAPVAPYQAQVQATPAAQVPYQAPVQAAPAAQAPYQSPPAAQTPYQPVQTAPAAQAPYQPVQAAPAVQTPYQPPVQAAPAAQTPYQPVQAAPAAQTPYQPPVQAARPVPSAPAAHAHYQAPPADRFTLADYAHLCAGARVHPTHVPWLRSLYGLSEEGWSALHARWQRALSRDPNMRAEWNRLVLERVPAWKR